MLSIWFNLKNSQNQLPQLRKEISWIKDVPAQALQESIKRLDKAYTSFFKNGGFPKWAKKGRYNSLTFPQDVKSNQVNTFILPKLGKVRVFKNRMPNGKLKTATITKECDGYYLSVTFESETKNKYPTDKNQAVGIDMGITFFCIDSNGQFVENQRIAKKYEKQLRIANRSLSRKKKFSNGWYKKKVVLSKLHRKIARVRHDFLHKISLEYVKNNSLVVVEDLKVKNMIRNKQLSKHIADTSWSMFFDMLSYKCRNYEKDFVKVNPQYTSQTCNSCGNVDKANRLSQSQFKCTMCFHETNADENASKNILSEGIALVRQREALACA
ncbi:transposase, IS605 OrfB family, central region [Bernardetia litoralis DSM 6794]|uniref:Transposase, IS605 OrfB family, central region n=1 Tax=Bernardetia litoralis (strain ATCC 23117 / DSM 6794 / NBRC 15988 / NCIMB 1366 / Fx l1 / Sio-4) TaxID=880071 RepID=I4AFD3_BERLS|nr:RNA-guided endonuclease TnpB family protein [Bernardetia litoralis]AFM02668.1 transposase, IS605 OrfB family, central region [Bernardetia litoralis DSM 6794]